MVNLAENDSLGCCLLSNNRKSNSFFKPFGFHPKHLFLRKWECIVLVRECARTKMCCVLCYIFCVLSSIGCYINDLVHASVAQIEFGCGSNNRLHFRGRSSTSCLLSFLLCGVHYLFITQPITFRLCYSFSHSERKVHRDLILSFQMRR